MNDTEQALFLHDFAHQLERRQAQERLKKKSRLWKPTATAATQLGYECERRIVYQRVMPWAAAPLDEQLASIFSEGDFHEPQVLHELEADLGLTLVNRRATFRDAKLDLVGQVDAETPVDGVGKVPLEVKALAFIPGENVGAGELAESERDLFRRYFAQLQVYLFLRAVAFGLFIFKSKATGLWRVIDVPLDYVRAELLLKRAERVRDATKAYVGAYEVMKAFSQDDPRTEEGNLPDDVREALDFAETALPLRIADRSLCHQCPFRASCNPADAPVDPAVLVLDEDFIEQLAKREEAQPQKKAYDKVHDIIRKRLEATPGDVLFVGPYRVEKKKWGKSWQLNVTKQTEERTSGLASE